MKAFHHADDLHDAANEAAAAINARLDRRGLALAPDDFEALRDAVALALQPACVVEVGR